MVDGAFGFVSGAIGAATAGAASALFDTGLSFLNGVITTGMQNNWTYDLGDFLAIGASAALSGLATKALKFAKIDMFDTSIAKSFKELVNEGTFKTVTSAGKEITTGFIKTYTTSDALITTASTVFVSFMSNLFASLIA